MARRTAEDAALTREALLDAALAAFAEVGFAATQLEEIARRARVTRGALYHHFDSKEALFLAVLRERWPSIMAPVTAPLYEVTGDPGAQVRRFVGGFVTAVNDDDDVRGLLRISVSGDAALPALAAHFPEKVDVLADWTPRLARLSGRSGPRGVARARVVVLALLGYSVERAMSGSESSVARRRFARALLASLGLERDEKARGQ